MIFNLCNCNNAIIFGSSRGIGFALSKLLCERYPHININLCHRGHQPSQDLIKLSTAHKNIQLHSVDVNNESDMHRLAEKFIVQEITFDLIINTIGFLHDQDTNPEKSLRQFQANDFIKSIEANTVPTAHIAKYFSKLISKKNISVFATLSAKVGSIEDNRIGGWHSYRMSKAALNMLLKNISIEFKRTNKCIVLAIHPGTTKTDLSKPYIKNTKYKLHSTDETANNILSVIDGKKLDHTGSFYSWDNSIIPW